MPMQPTVVLYTHPGCPGGERALRFFQRRRIPVRVRDIAQNPEARAEFEALGCIGTPVIRIGKDTFMGFDEDAIAACLDQTSWEVGNG